MWHTHYLPVTSPFDQVAGSYAMSFYLTKTQLMIKQHNCLADKSCVPRLPHKICLGVHRVLLKTYVQTLESLTTVSPGS